MRVTKYLLTAAMVVGTTVAFTSRVVVARRGNHHHFLSFAGGVAFQDLSSRSSSASSSRNSHQSRALSATSNGSETEFVQKEIQSNPVVIFSKTYCPYCTSTKDLFLKQLKLNGNNNVKIYELDTMDNGDTIQSSLLQLTGQRTVPNVFINGQHIGGNDKCQAANSSGTLKKLLKDAGVTV